MTDFSTPSDIVNAFATTASAGGRSLIFKNTMTTVASFFYSLWTLPGTPAAGVAPTTWAEPTSTLAGSWSISYTNPTGGATARVLLSDLILGSSVTVLQMYDRVGHVGGLSGTVTTAQTTGASLTAAVTDGRCQANGSDVMWALEWYTATGATGVTATISYTNQAGTSGKTTTVVLPASVPANRIYPITTLAAGDTSIKSVDSVTLSATTGTAGNFGVTAYKYLYSSFIYQQADTRDFAKLAMPQLGNNVCLCPIVYAQAGTTGPIVGSVVIGCR